VSLKIIPDLYDIISGQARTNQIYGFPLIEIMPELMQPWEYAVKRAIDIVFSFVVLFVGLPIWLLVAIAIKLDSKGSIFYMQERVGKDEKHFHIIKFRSMDEEAERHSGPVWANKQDPRITRVGKIIRKLRIDEIPQLINVLDGKMSLVGPRPERPFFVDQLSREIPLYKRRLKVRPGITGWAQVKHKYDESIEDVRKKVQYDLSYIENMSLRMDLKILLNTIAVVLKGEGH
jgi:exopolysaccharide biosynthesis polyprenyl glycosylphosphotransferase